jgi:hypothetical protein
MTRTLSIALATASLIGAAAPATQAATLDRSLAQRGDGGLQLTQYGNGGYGYDRDRDRDRAYGGCYAGERGADCRERMRWERRSHHHYVWRDGRYVDENGAAVAAGILGFALGSAIAGSDSDHDYYVSHRYDRGWRYRCSNYYPGFDWRSGTYVGRDGYRHYCTR